MRATPGRWIAGAIAMLLSGCAAVHPMERDSVPAEPASRPAEPASRPAEPGSPLEHYRPKSSADTVSDYRPSLRPAVAALAAATLDALPELVKALEGLNRSAAERPGRRREGNTPLGAEPMEYVPSDEELLASEAGRRIETVVDSAGAEQVERRLEEAGTALSWIEYPSITFYHADVMGTGRFTYAKPPRKVRLYLRRSRPAA